MDWTFLTVMLLPMGFSSIWTSWIMSCAPIVTYSICFNGQRMVSFSPTQGLRQGDPLLSYSFLLLVDVLSILLINAIYRRVLQEFSMGRQAPGMSHLLFADDCMMLFQVNTDQSLSINNFLSECEREHTCSLMFGKKCSIESQASAMVIMEVVA